MGPKFKEVFELLCREKIKAVETETAIVKANSQAETEAAVAAQAAAAEIRAAAV